MRIRMPDGHIELSIEGVNYKPDETGAFLVPDQAAKNLIAVHGAVPELGLPDLEQAAMAAEAMASAAKVAYEQRTKDAKAARAVYEHARLKAKMQVEAKAREVLKQGESQPA
jgi:hypothetical protein